MIQNFFWLGGGGGGGVVFHHQGSTVGNMGVMICLNQGGLRSLSASSLFVIFSRKVAASPNGTF